MKKTVEGYKVLSVHFRQTVTVMFRMSNRSMIKFFVDNKNANCKKQKDSNTTNKPSMIDVSFKNPHKFADILFLESEELVRY
ncbi:MAG: hypothetical protein HZA84_04885 [Thaumarchaeota archaeon]|nr:hypothetical protein [Nitrososphaerota archaeon]